MKEKEISLKALNEQLRLRNDHLILQLQKDSRLRAHSTLLPISKLEEENKRLSSRNIWIEGEMAKMKQEKENSLLELWFLVKKALKSSDPLAWEKNKEKERETFQGIILHFRMIASFLEVSLVFPNFSLKQRGILEQIENMPSFGLRKRTPGAFPSENSHKSLFPFIDPQLPMQKNTTIQTKKEEKELTKDDLLEMIENFKEKPSSNAIQQREQPWNRHGDSILLGPRRNRVPLDMKFGGKGEGSREEAIEILDEEDDELQMAPITLKRVNL